MFPNEDPDTLLMHRDSFIYKDLVGFVPQNGRGISLYCVSDNSFRFFSLEKHSGYIANCYLSQNVLWIFPATGSNTILSINLDNYIIKEHGIIDRLSNTLINHVVGKDNRVWLPIKGESRIVELELDSFESKDYLLDINEIESIDYFADHIWIISDNAKNVYSWDYDNHYIESYKTYVEDIDLSDLYCSFAMIHDELFLVPTQGVPVLVFNKSNNYFEKHGNLPVDFKTYDPRFSPYFISRVKTVMGFLSLPCNCNYAVLFEETSGEVIYREIENLHTDNERQLRASLWKGIQNSVICESESFDLKDYISVQN